MRLFNKLTGAVLATALAATIAGTAGAQEELKLNQVGAALAFPLIDGRLQTYITITNVGANDRNLHFNAISADGWNVTDFDCPVTASETVLITYTMVNEGLAQIAMECNFGTGAPVIVSRLVTWRQGVLFVTNETYACGDGSCTTNENDLFGDFVVVHPAAGLAWSAGAVPFQGKNPLADGVTDRDYKFDNSEYSMFPSTLATNFIATGPNPAIGSVIEASLVLFTLDGRANIGSQAALDIVFFDDDETPTSAHYSFDCFTIVPLRNIDPNFDAIFLGSGAGHMYLTAIDADQNSNVHDNKFGNGNAIRVAGVHGWLFQTIGGGAAWGRTLAQGMMPQDVDGDDVPTFDGL